jgi:hypothetical protein
MRKNLSGFVLKCLVLIVCLFVGAQARAQYDNGSLVGTIRDASGAPMPHVKVAITNIETGIVTQATTNGTGEYNVPSLRVGTYKIVASASGFSDAEADNIGISVGVSLTIDLSLKVGSAATTVEVSGVALQLETETSERGQTVTNYESEALPLVSRNYSDLLALVPGSRQAPDEIFITSSNSLVRAGSFNVNGQRSMFNNYLLDGIDNNAYGESNQGFDNQVIAVPPDSVAEFQIVTNNENAEYGRSSGATINVSSKSGTNQQHATIYEFLRNTDLNAPGFFKPTLIGTTGLSVPFQKPTFNRNQFGFDVGGPIIKNKLFYFLDYEGFRQVLKTLTPLTLPTKNELNADLVVPVRDPLTGVVYAANTPIPSAVINPLSAAILADFKAISANLPTSGLATTGAATDDYAALVPFTDNSDKGDLRFDWQITPMRSAFLRVSDRKEDAINFPSIPIPLDGQTNGHIRLLDQQIAAGFTQLFGANKIADVRLGLNRTKAGKYNLSIGNTAFSTPGTSSYIPGLPSNPVVAGGLPSTSISGGFSSFGRQSTNPQWQDPAFIDPKVNFTWVKGVHSLKFGYEYQHLWMAVNDNNPLYGAFAYGGGYSVCPSGTSITGTNTVCAGGSAVADNYWADFLFGTTSSYQLANFYEAHVTNNTHNLYAQDDWKVSNKLTLNLGLRWEYTSPYADLHNHISNFDPASQTVFTTTPGAVAGNGITPVSFGGTYGKTLVHPDYKDYAPRIGFAFAPFANTAIRGGFGISYGHYTRAGSGDVLSINAPQAQFASVTQKAPTTTNHCASPLPAQIIANGTTTPSCYATSDQGFPSGLVTSFNSSTDNITWVPKNTKDSYVESYFISVQQQLGKNRVLDVAYVGNHGVHLQGFLNGNQENPALGASTSTPTVGFARPFANWPSDITEAANEFWSNYNALQVKYEQRMVAGLTVLNAFTWEHSLDNASASLEGNTPSPQNGYNIAADYSQSDYNLPLANVTTIVYELPFGRGRKYLQGANGFVNALLGGWQTSLINTAQAGTPFNITYSPNSAQAVSPQISATYRGANEYRPDHVSGVPITQGTSHRAAGTGYINYVNYAAFVLPPIKDGAGAQLSPFGTSSRNPGRTPPYNETDFALNKKFNTPISRVKVEFRAELYNIFNHTNFFLPSTVGGTQGTTTQILGVGATPALNAITGGVPTSGGQISSTFEPRIVQFALKILY